MRIQPEDTALVIIDIQGKLAHLMHEKELLFRNVQRMIDGAGVLGLPIVWVEQNPRGLGPTVEEVAGHLQGHEPVEKMCFSCGQSRDFMSRLEATGRKNVLLTGIETHICVFQTARDLLEKGYGVQVVVDAVSSRTAQNKAIGIERMQMAGALPTCVEMALYELLGEAGGPKFKEILKLIK